MTNKLKKLVDKLEDSINENGCDVWMHDLSDTVWTSFPEPIDYHSIDSKGEVKVIKYKGFYKEFDTLREEIYKLNNKIAMKK